MWRWEIPGIRMTNRIGSTFAVARGHWLFPRTIHVLVGIGGACGGAGELKCRIIVRKVCLDFSQGGETPKYWCIAIIRYQFREFDTQAYIYFSSTGFSWKSQSPEIMGGGASGPLISSLLRLCRWMHCGLNRWRLWVIRVVAVNAKSNAHYEFE